MCDGVQLIDFSDISFLYCFILLVSGNGLNGEASAICTMYGIIAISITNCDSIY